MKQELVRFGVAMEGELLAELDQLAEERGCTRSELLRDLARKEVSRRARTQRVPAVAAVTLVYNHHVRNLSERLTAIQHGLGEQVRSTMHVHLDAENCLEVIVLRGRSDLLRGAAERMLATKGVSHGGWEMVTERGLRGKDREKEKEREKGHGNVHVDVYQSEGTQERELELKHAHAREHGHEHAPDRRRLKGGGRSRAGSRKGR